MRGCLVACVHVFVGVHACELLQLNLPPFRHASTHKLQVKRGLKTKKIKTVIIAPNIEEGSSEGGLDDNVKGIIDTARENEAVVVFALNRCRPPGFARNN